MKSCKYYAIGIYARVSTNHKGQLDRCDAITNAFIGGSKNEHYRFFWKCYKTRENEGDRLFQPT